jgi:adenylate cyclase
MLKIGEWLFDAPTRRMFRGHDERKLSLKAAGVLLALAETPGRVWSRDALLERVWPAVTVGEEVLTHAIAELRRALGDDFRAPRYLETVHKSGYRLVGPIEDTAQRDRMELDAGDEHALTFDLSAYASYLRARELYERGGRASTLASVATFASIVGTYPRFALAHAGLAKALTFLGTYYDARLGDPERALDHARTAQKIAPNVADGHAAEGLIFAIARNAPQSVKSFNAAIALAPESNETHYLLGRACLADLDFDLAALALERAAQLRADDYHSLVMAGKVRRRVGEQGQAYANYALALPRTETRLRAEPNDNRALCAKARCLWQLGRADEAFELMERVAAHPDPLNYHLACTMARAGESRRALDVLEEVVDMGWRHWAWLDRDPDFDQLRDDRRFKRITRRLGASA